MGQKTTVDGIVLEEQQGCTISLLIDPTEEWRLQNQPVTDPPIVSELVDEEKVWMAEALITQESEIETLKARLAAAGL